MDEEKLELYPAGPIVNALYRLCDKDEVLMTTVIEEILAPMTVFNLGQEVDRCREMIEEEGDKS